MANVARSVHLLKKFCTCASFLALSLSKHGCSGCNGSMPQVDFMEHVQERPEALQLLGVYEVRQSFY
jgi:hypothetical protein